MLVTVLSLKAATFTVTNTSDSGPGSLRQAILDANTAPGVDQIHFAIPGAGPFTISPLSQLPAFTGPVTLDATTQPGYVSQPLVELNGTSAGVESVGLRVTSSSCVIRGLAINRFAVDGVRLESTLNTIQGNFIGTDPTGLLLRPNGYYGIFVLGGWSNTIGGLSIAQRNVLAGNDTGLYLLNTFGNTVQGNYVGVGTDGLTRLGNTNNGIVLYNAENNLIGGTSPGARNVISGNGGSGLNLNTTGTARNSILGNYLGVTASGTLSVSNRGDGISLNDAVANQIGSVIAGAANVISGNGQAGVFLNGVNCRSNILQGNLIGLEASGSNAVPNNYAGITLAGAIHNTIGGTTPAARNVISGNRQEGIFLGLNSRTNRIIGNYIGTQSNGLVGRGNQASGVAANNANDNFIGGGNTGEGNVISGNGGIGVWLLNTNSVRNQVRGNYIGVKASGNSALGNTTAGVGVSDAANNQIGGAGPNDRNVISGNGYPANGGGVFLTGTKAAGNRLLGNRIGTDFSGQSAIPNRFEGIYVVAASSNHIGGVFAGEGNLISGNTTRGLRITNSWYTEIHGNYFGTRADGSNALSNGQFNVELEEHTSFSRIGVLAGNRIGFSGGGFAGVRVRDFSTNNAILNNVTFGNTHLGIDLSLFSISPNDLCDSDVGGNQLQNYPELTVAYGGVTGVAVRGTLNSRPNQTYRVQFFASPACSSFGHGEGHAYLGEIQVTTPSGCSTNFVASFPVPVAAGQVLTATATDAANNTSEFSACATVQLAPPLQLQAGPGNTLQLIWPNAVTGFVLRETASLTTPAVWNVVTNPPSNSGGQWVVSVIPQHSQRYYRLSFE